MTGAKLTSGAMQDDLPFRQRICSRASGNSWRAAFQQEIINVDIKPLGDDPFHLSMDVISLDSVTMVNFDISPQTMSRTNRSLVDGYEGVALSIAVDKPLLARQSEQEFAMEPGQAVLMDARIASDLASACSTQFLGFKLSRGWFNRIGIDLPSIATKIQPSLPLGLLKTYSERLHQDQGLPGSTLRTLYDRQVSELIAAALIAGGARADHDKGVAVDARYRCIREAIRRFAREPEFSLGHLSRLLGIPERTIQNDMSRRGKSFSALLRQERLASAHRALLTGTASIAQIAFDAGFQDLSTFNRSFRAHYGMSPRDMCIASGASRR